MFSDGGACIEDMLQGERPIAFYDLLLLVFKLGKFTKKVLGTIAGALG